MLRPIMLLPVATLVIALHTGCVTQAVWTPDVKSLTVGVGNVSAHAGKAGEKVAAEGGEVSEQGAGLLAPVGVILRGILGGLGGV